MFTLNGNIPLRPDNGGKRILYLCSKRHELGVIFLVEIIQSSHVFTVTDQPVDGWKMLSLSKFLVQTPKHLKQKQNMIFSSIPYLIV